ncbi:hypothetical protein Z043_123285, partial [Scleropages formosus]
AKDKFEQEERRKELKHARGEDTWMLPQVDLRLQELEQEHSSARKKKKKEKKSRKSKKERKKKAKKDEKAGQQEASSDSSEDSEDEWVETPPKADALAKAWKIPAEKLPSAVDQAPPSQRDEWMTFDFLTMKTSSVVERRAERERAKEVEREKAQAVEQAGLHKLELNPYWKDGGSGLPSEDTPVLKATVVDDGGLSWLQKSYQRMREQAQREQRSLEEVVSERYGSMEKFLKRLEEAENATRTKGGHQEERGWKRVGPRSSDIRQDHDLSPVASRGKEQGRDEDRDRDMGGDRNKSGARARDRDRGGHAEEARQRTREEQQPHGETERARPGLSRASLKAKFLKPSDGGHDMSATWGVRRHTPVELLQPSDSEGKPAGGYPAWRKMSCSGQDAIRSTSLEGQSGSGPRAPSPGEVRTEIIMGQQQQKQPHGKVPQSRSRATGTLP